MERLILRIKSFFYGSCYTFFLKTKMFMYGLLARDGWPSRAEIRYCLKLLKKNKTRPMLSKTILYAMELYEEGYDPKFIALVAKEGYPVTRERVRMMLFKGRMWAWNGAMLRATNGN